MKKCSKCKKVKELDGFHRSSLSKDGLDYHCKQCNKELRPTKEKQCEYVKKHREKVIAGQIQKIILTEYECSSCKTIKLIEEFTKDKYSVSGHTYACKICRSKETERYRQTDQGKENIRAYDRNRYATNIEHKIHHNVSRMINKTILGIEKGACSIWKFLPYTPKQFREHIEKQFEPWMNWDNYGKCSTKVRHWNIEHKIPKVSFRFSSPNDLTFQKCWSLVNLEPKDAIENTKKGKKQLYTEEEVFGQTLMEL